MIIEPNGKCHECGADLPERKLFCDDRCEMRWLVIENNKYEDDKKKESPHK